MTEISWTTETWNPVVGCSIVSRGCTNCYAMRMAHRLGANPKTPHYRRLTMKVNGNPVWNHRIAAAPDHIWQQPLRRRKPTTWFVNSMGDLFHEAVPDEMIDRAFAIMALCPQHTFQCLSKRPERMRAYIDGRQTGARDKFASSRNASTIIGRVSRSIDPVPTIENPRHRRRYDEGGAWHIWEEALENVADEKVFATWPLPNVWLGTSVEDQASADARIPHLLATPAALRFISAEPLLGPVDLTALQPDDPPCEINAMAGTHGVIRPHGGSSPRLDFVIVGGESGPGARPMHPAWARALRDQCAAAGTPYHFKQWGEWLPDCQEPAEGFVWNPDTPGSWCDSDQAMSRVGKKAAGRYLDGVVHDAMPPHAGGDQ